MARKQGNRGNGKTGPCAIALVAGATLLAGCAAGVTPENREPALQGASYQAQLRGPQGASQHFDATAIAQNRTRCTDLTHTHTTGAELTAKTGPHLTSPDTRVLLSQGDLVEVLVEDDESFSGTVEVSGAGTIQLPHLQPVAASGKTPDQVAEVLTAALLRAQIYASRPKVTVRLLDAAGARVFVSGAVFVPGAIRIGGMNANDRDAVRQAAAGATANGRRLSEALQNAGGIRPDADLSAIIIERDGRQTVVDARAAVRGAPFDDPILLAGDHVTVQSRRCFQEHLVAPSPVTPPGVKVFMSNLTQPAASNASSAIGKDARELRYGTRLLQAAVGMNCAGGTRSVTADRSVLLITRNPLSGESIVIERRIEQLLRNADRDDFNPYLMPEDALVCYDSAVSNALEIVRGIGSAAGSAALLIP